jgi:hypothetical protein
MDTPANPEIAGPSHRHAAHRAAFLRWLETRRTSTGRGTGYSLWAQAAIVVITVLWSRTADAIYFSGDAITYFKMLADGSWVDAYRLQPTMFVILSLLKPHTFADYIVYSDVIPLTVLLVAFYRLNYSRIDQFILIVFFSSSFYGVHFLLDFQRQLYAIAFFMLAVSLNRGSFLARIASIGSHAFSFALYIFWAVRKLRPRTAMLLCIPAIPLIYLLAGILDSEKVASYATSADVSSTVLIKQSLNMFYAVIILFTLRKSENDLRTMSCAYLCVCLPSLFWAGYRGAFARVDYYFFPALIAFWPGSVDEKRRQMCRIVIIVSTVMGFYLWIQMNFAWIINGIG